MERPSTPREHGDVESVTRGIDAVPIERIETVPNEFDTSFGRRVFAPMERRYCERQADPPQHYAARRADEDAFHRTIALGPPPIPFRSVAVDRSGNQPTLGVHGPAETALAVTAGSESDSPSTGTAASPSHDRHADRAIGQPVLDWSP